MQDYQKELDYNSQIDRLRSAVRLLRLYRRADPSNIYNTGANGFGTGFFVERKSQKGIIIGAGGAMTKEQIMAIPDRDARMRAIAQNQELFS